MNKIVVIVSGGMVDRILSPYPNDIEVEVIDLDTDVPEEYDKARERADEFIYSPDYLPLY